MTVKEVLQAFLVAFYEPLKLAIAIVSAPFVVLSAFVRGHDFQLRHR